MTHPRTTSSRARFLDEGRIAAIIKRAVDPLVAFLPDDAVAHVRRVLSEGARFDPVLRKFMDDVEESLRRLGEASSDGKRVSGSGSAAHVPPRRSRRGV